MPVIFPPRESAAMGRNVPDIPDGTGRNAALYRNSAWVDLSKRTLNPALTLDLFY